MYRDTLERDQDLQTAAENHSFPRVPRVLVKLRQIHTLQLRTRQRRRQGRKYSIQFRKRRSRIQPDPIEQIRARLCEELIHETLQIIALCERLGVVDPTGEIANVETGKGVCCAGVAADAEDLGEFGGVVEDVSVEIGDSVLVADGALVPVVGDTLIPWIVGEASRLAGDGEEAL